MSASQDAQRGGGVCSVLAWPGLLDVVWATQEEILENKTVMYF